MQKGRIQKAKYGPTPRGVVCPSIAVALDGKVETAAENGVSFSLSPKLQRL